MRPSTILALGALVAAAVLAPGATTAAAAASGHVSVYFVQGEQLMPVTRPGTTRSTRCGS